MVKLRLDSAEIRKDVCMIVFEIVQDHSPRAIMDELRTLVEERSVVLVGFDHEKIGVGKPRRNAEIQRHPADQEAGIQAGVLK